MGDIVIIRDHPRYQADRVKQLRRIAADMFHSQTRRGYIANGDNPNVSERECGSRRSSRNIETAIFVSLRSGPGWRCGWLRESG
jgi:hypothetical protein